MVALKQRVKKVKAIVKEQAEEIENHEKHNSCFDMKIEDEMAAFQE